MNLTTIKYPSRFDNYLMVILRNFLKRKLFTLINIIGLAVGMAVCLLPD
jgi:putative ABC transport system permease protein